MDFSPWSKFYIQWNIYLLSFNKHMHLYNPTPYQDIGHYSQPRKFPHLPPNQYLTSTHKRGNCCSFFFQQKLVLPVLELHIKWNHIGYTTLCLASLTLHIFLDSSMLFHVSIVYFHGWVILYFLNVLQCTHLFCY